MRGKIGNFNMYWLSHINGHICSLSDKSGRKTFPWTPEIDNSFTIMKIILAVDVLIVYPNNNIPFIIYTDASDYQMCAIIIQQKQYVTYRSCKLETQQDYHTMEKELLSIVMVLKEF